MSQSKGSKPVALIVDDQKSICTTLAEVIGDEGWDSVAVYSGAQAIEAFKERRFDLVFLDVWMDHLNGIEVLQRLKEIDEKVPVVIMSGHGTIKTAVKVTKLGALDFLEKPLSLEKIIPLLEKSSQIKKIREFEINNLRTYQIIGKSPAIAALHQQIKVVAPRNSWVLITGENGTGKEIVARNIHLNSRRAEGAFVAVNCAAIPDGLIESELFGHKKGAFANAVESRVGKFELAHKGTLFLDEIGDMSLATQAKILRILQEQTFERVGGSDQISVDVRVVAATNKNLLAEIRRGLFREDLYYRLNVIPIHMLPLRERVEDIPILADYFIHKICEEMQMEPKALEEDALSVLANHTWGGNVRELKNLIERLCILSPSKLIGREELSSICFREQGHARDIKSGEQSFNLTLKEAKHNFEKDFIVNKLDQNKGNISKTAEVIGVERSNLHRKLKSYEIDIKK